MNPTAAAAAAPAAGGSTGFASAINTSSMLGDIHSAGMAMIGISVAILGVVVVRRLLGGRG